MAPDLTDAQLDAIAERVATDDDLAASIAQQLPTGRLGGRYLLNRRQLLQIGAGGAAAVAGLTALGVDEAEAQAAAGQVGTESEPVDVEAAALDAQSVSTDSVNTGSATVTNQVDAGSVNTNVASLTEQSESDLPDTPDDGDIVNVNGQIYVWSE